MHLAHPAFIVNPLSVCPVSDMIWVHTFWDKDPTTRLDLGSLVGATFFESARSSITHICDVLL